MSRLHWRSPSLRPPATCCGMTQIQTEQNFNCYRIPHCYGCHAAFGPLYHKIGLTTFLCRYWRGKTWQQCVLYFLCFPHARDFMKNFEMLQFATIILVQILYLHSPCSVLPLKGLYYYYYYYLLSLFIIIIVIIILVIPFMHGIYIYILETNHVSSVYSVAALLYLQFVLNVMLLRPWNMFCVFTSAHCATSRKVAGSTPDGVIGIWHWNNHSGCTVALYVASASNGN